MAVSVLCWLTIVLKRGMADYCELAVCRGDSFDFSLCLRDKALGRTSAADSAVFFVQRCQELLPHMADELKMIPAGIRSFVRTQSS